MPEIPPPIEQLPSGRSIYDIDLSPKDVRHSLKFEFDVLLGLTFVYTKVGLTTDLVGQVPVDVKADRLWTDPVIATNFAYRPHKRIEIAAYGDLGYTLLNDNLTYQLSANLNFLISRLIYISAGYRIYYLDFAAKKSFFAGSLQGMIVKFGFQF